jgi:hypothetical protein
MDGMLGPQLGRLPALTVPLVACQTDVRDPSSLRCGGGSRSCSFDGPMRRRPVESETDPFDPNGGAPQQVLSLFVEPRKEQDGMCCGPLLFLLLWSSTSFDDGRSRVASERVRRRRLLVVLLMARKSKYARRPIHFPPK